MKKIILFVFIAIPAAVLSQLQFTMVNPSTQTLTIQNYGSEVDIASYRLCSLFDYTWAGISSSEVSIVTGDFLLSANESVTIVWTATSGGFDPVAADLGLYLPFGDFGDSANMMCFMEYGAGMLGREPEAIEAGLWEFNTFVSGNEPFVYTGDGTQSGATYWSAFVQPTTNIVFNEIDSDTPGADMLEFIELFGAPGEVLDGMVMVFFNGSNDFSYEAYDLDGMACDANGFFVLGNSAVPGVDYVINNNNLQNGPDAVALYFGDADDFPSNTMITLENMIDAAVYDTGDPDDAGLLALTGGSGQVNEDANNDAVNQSLSRVPDGGEQLNTSTFVAQTPTPGATNILSLCDGGFVLTGTGSSQETVCIDENPDVITFAHMTTQPGAIYEYVITDASENILVYPTTDSYDFNSLVPGTYAVYGISYYGTIDASTAEEGDPVSGMIASGACIDVSASFITIIIQVCEIGEGCAELFFSEYYEGEGNNKALEIVNPTNLPVDLTEYFINTYSNGSIDASNVFGLSGTLEPGAVVVISNSSADQTFQDIADALSNTTLFNGNDAIELRHNGVPVDVIGVVGTDPGLSWIVGSGSTMNFDLVREPDVTAPTTDWILSSSQWEVYAIDDLSHLGNHTFISCSTSMPVVSFSAINWIVEENVGTVEILVNVYNPLYEVEVEVNVIGGSAIADVDYTDDLPVTLTFPQGSTEPQVVSINIVDDVEEETFMEDIQLEMTGNDELVQFINEQANVYILQSDFAYPFYDIAEVSTANGAGVADSVSVDCELRGVVHGINFNSSGIWFTLIDSTDGILVYNTLEDFGYSVQEGDSVHVQGLIFQFMGQLQIVADNIVYISSDNEVEEPLLVDQIFEEHESHMIMIECVEVVDASEWTNESAGFLVTVSDGDQDFGLFIDGDTDIYGTEVPDGHFSITGIGHQFDPTDPYTGGYQIYPRSLSDFTDFVVASFVDPGEIEFGDADDVTVNFISTSIGADSWLWDFGDGNQSTDENPTHIYTHTFLSSNSSITISLTITSGTCSDTQSITINTTYVGMGEWELASFNLYPVPCSDILNVESEFGMNDLMVMDAYGRIVFANSVNGVRRTSLDVSKFEPGLYLLEVKTESARALRKFEVK